MLGDHIMANNPRSKHFAKNLDSNKHLIGFTNGVYDIQKDIFRNGEPSDLISMNTNYNFISNYTETYNNMMNFLNDILPSIELEYLLTYLATGLEGNFLEYFTVVSGTGANGKTKFFDLVKHTFGEYYGSISSTIFTRLENMEENPSPILLSKNKCKVVVTSEPERNKKMNTSSIKLITGNETKELRKLYSNTPENFEPNFLTFMQCNDIPEPDGMDGGFIRRFKKIVFGNKFVSNPIKNNEKLIGETLKNKIPTWKQDFMLLLINKYREF